MANSGFGAKPTHIIKDIVTTQQLYYYCINCF